MSQTSTAARAEDCPPAVQSEGLLTRELAIVNKRGLHARAAAKFVQIAERFDAEVTVTRYGETVGGTSIMGLMMLAAGPGSTVTVEGNAAARRRLRSTRSPSSSRAASARTSDGRERPAARTDMRARTAG